MSIALKIDVDTYRGLAEGSNRLAAYLHAKKIPASFFITMGPDTSGLAAMRIFRYRGFMKKMKRTSALSVYGLRTALSGTLLPARPMAVSFIKEMRQWRDLGFEISPHGYDHIRWHDGAASWNVERAREEWNLIADMYQEVMGQQPTSFAAPGWQAGEGTWQAMDKMNLLYHSDTRGEYPYFFKTSSPAVAGGGSMDSPPVAGGNDETLEIPTTLPTWDEMLAWDHVTPATLVAQTLQQLKPDALNVWTIHAEFEGGPYFESFKQMIERCLAAGETWDDLRQVATRSLQSRGAIPSCTFIQGTRAGRAGTVTCQSQLATRVTGGRFDKAQSDQA